MYEQIRKRKTDCQQIAKNTGLSIEEIKRIKNYLFIDEHELQGGRRRFDANYSIAESWQRLIDGKNIQKHDLILLKHEIYEKKLIDKGYKQGDAHIVASRKYDYRKESEYYERNNKYKNKK